MLFIGDLDEDKVVRAFFSANVGCQFLVPFLRVFFDPWEDGATVSTLSLVHFVALCDVTQELSRTSIPRDTSLVLKEACKFLKRPRKL